MLRSRNDKNSNGCRCHISSQILAHFIDHPSSGALSLTLPSTSIHQPQRQYKPTCYPSSFQSIWPRVKQNETSKSLGGITDASKSLCRILLEKEQTVPQDSLFRDDIFDKACQKIQDRNKAKIVQDIT
jgi:hypothetical protein